MCSPYFRRFPELPAELRLQIWQEACLALNPSHRGLHYVTVQDNNHENEAVAIPCKWPSWPRSLSQNINRSAYFINGGLWKACKESREVIAKHTEYYNWLDIHWQPIQDSRELIRRQPSSSRMDLIRVLQGLRLEETQNYQPSSGYGPPPAIIDYDGEGGEECRMLVYPSRDMFCIKVDDWHSIRRGRHPDIQMPFIRYKDDDADYFQCWSHNRYQSLFKQPDLQEIALEFDPSWLTDVPHSIWQMAGENSARGYLAHWLLDNADPWDYAEGLSIIDKEAKWFAEDPVKTVYRDFDAEYVKVNWDNSATYAGDRVFPSAFVFMEKIHNYAHDLYPDINSPGGWLDGYGPDIEYVISLFVRRDNEVKPAIWSCPSKCDSIGWCICSGDKTKRRQEKEDPDAYLNHLMETVWLRKWDDDL